MPRDHKPPILIRGGGDLASGVALRLHRAGFNVVITELPQPLAVRRAVSFSEAVFNGTHQVEEVAARLVKWEEITTTLEADEIPVLVDPEADVLRHVEFFAVVDARLIKKTPKPLPVQVPLHIGLGPGFHAGENCDAVIETRRSHTLGRVFWTGLSQADTGQPEGDPRRVLRAPHDGVIRELKQIGDHCEEAEAIAIIGDQTSVLSPFKGVLRGLIHNGLNVTKGMKIGDVDPRDDPSACFLVSDKSLAVGGGVLEAVMMRLRDFP